MDKIKRAYYLPGKLIAAFEKEILKQGYIREKVVAASILAFLEADPNGRAGMFERLDGFLNGKPK